MGVMDDGYAVYSFAEESLGQRVTDLRPQRYRLSEAGQCERPVGLCDPCGRRLTARLRRQPRSRFRSDAPARAGTGFASLMRVSGGPELSGPSPEIRPLCG